MIRYLIDSSALWRVERDDPVGDAWTAVIESSAVGSCQPQRVEFKASARDRAEYDDMTDMFDALYPDVPVHKSAWQWIESAQYRLAAHGHNRALSVVDLLIAATAATNGLIVLHDDNDFVTLTRVVPDVAERNIHELPEL